LRDLRINRRAKSKHEKEMGRINRRNPRLLMQAPLSASAASSWFDIGGSAAGNFSPESQHHTSILLQPHRSRIHRGRRAAHNCTEQPSKFKGVVEAQLEA
jgi:hypothetical protein